MFQDPLQVSIKGGKESPGKLPAQNCHHLALPPQRGKGGREAWLGYCPLHVAAFAAAAAAATLLQGQVKTEHQKNSSL